MIKICLFDLAIYNGAALLGAYVNTQIRNEDMLYTHRVAEALTGSVAHPLGVTPPSAAACLASTRARRAASLAAGHCDEGAAEAAQSRNSCMYFVFFICIALRYVASRERLRTCARRERVGAAGK